MKVRRYKKKYPEVTRLLYEKGALVQMPTHARSKPKEETHKDIDEVG